MFFDERIFKRIVSPDTFRRGRDYYLAGAVTSVSVERNSHGDYLVRGQVIGTRTHDVSLTVAENKETILSHACNCHESSGICKHVIALGLAAPAPGEAFDKGRVSLRAQALRSARLAGKRKMLIGSGGASGVVMETRKPGPRIRQEQHLLDDIRIRISYDKKSDTLFIEAVAKYGPFAFSLFGSNGSPESETMTDERGTIHEAWRDVDREEECRQWFIAYYDPSNVSEDGRLRISGEQMYWFVKETMPELDFRYPIEVDASAKEIVDVKTADVESDWNLTSAGVDLFDFSVDWHCANAKLSPLELKEMIQDHRPFFRAPDGSFIECKNTAEVESLLSLISRAKKAPSGDYSVNLFNAPGIVTMLEQSHSARLASMNRTFEQFLDEVKTGKPVEPTAIPEPLDTVMRPYQKDGVAWGMFLQKYRFGGILADDMGLGKTLQVLVMLKLTKEQGNYPGPSLILCPKTVMQTWADEAARFVPDLSVLVVDGTAEERERQIASAGAFDVIVTSYSLFQRDFLQFRELKTFAYLILDEAQYIKNAGTNTAKAVKMVLSQFRLAITGTPLENGVHELWSIFDFLMPGFLGHAEDFRRQYERPISERNDGDALKRLRNKVQPFMLRRTKSSELKELPPKIEQVRSCQLTPEQLVVYARTLESVRKDVFNAVEEKGFERSRIEILSALMKLRRACDHPSLVDPRLPRTEELSGKMASAMELVREAVSGGHKVLLFSQFTTMLDILRESLEGQGIGHCTIEGKTRDRSEQVRKFEHDPSTNVFLLSLRAGGTGLTLTAADTVILFDPWWNPMVEQQAMDRAHRIGQMKTVNVYKLITKNTVEEKVVALQERKRQVFDALMLESAQAIRHLTWDDLKGLFE